MTFTISTMLDPGVYEHPTNNIELIETHISWVVLTGEFAYKIKKPVDFGFLDFSTLDKRYACCVNEVELNRRLAPDIYLDVVAICGTEESPVINAQGEVIEYAVKMSQFPQSAQLDEMLTAGLLNEARIDAIAEMVARFHQSIAVADNSTDFGNSTVVHHPVRENFTQIREHLDTEQYAQTLAGLENWSQSKFIKLESFFDQRKADGFIRECHGDMHLRNMLWLETKTYTGPAAFDCIEFNEHLRWIDVISEVAFLVMDLQDREQHSLANRFLNHYLEITGDYNGLTALPYYLCYRALVRAKVNALRLKQATISASEQEAVIHAFSSYLELAVAYTQQARPKLIIMRGMSASGKSTVSQQLVDTLGAIRIRSDVERKRLFDIDPTTTATNDIDTGIYSKQASQQTYAKLAELSASIIEAGYSIIVDAAFLAYEQRQPFMQLATHLDVPCIILEITAPAEILRQRIIDRKYDVSDADLGVLEHQLANWQALHSDETRSAVSVDTSETLNLDGVIDAINAIQ